MKLSSKLLGVCASLLLVLPYSAFAAKVKESIQVADHFMFQAEGDPTIAPGATILIRDLKNGVITATVSSAALVPGDAYSIWWVVFNRPWFCATPWVCGSSDLGNPAVRGSVFWGGGLIADGDGYGNTQIEMTRGKTNRELFGPMTNTGLQNAGTAEIHLVLRTHGPAGVAGSVADQVGSANLACPAPEDGGCANKFFSVHRVK